MPIRHRIGTLADAQLDGDYSPNRPTDNLYSAEYLARQKELVERIKRAREAK